MFTVAFDMTKNLVYGCLIISASINVWKKLAFGKVNTISELSKYCTCMIFLHIIFLVSLCFRVPYLALAKTMELIENTSGRLRTIEILANFYRSVVVLSPDDLLYCVYLCLNKVAPAFEGNV